MTIILNGTTGVTFPNGVTMSDGTSAPVTVAQGGTGANTAANARTSLGLAIGTDVLAPNGSGANLTSLNATAISAGTLASARLPSSGVNAASITTGTLAVAQGGTGAASLTANNVLLGNGTSAVQVVAPGSSGNVLTSNGTTWTSSAPSGGVTSLNGQTGAITNTGFNAIGSYAMIIRDSGGIAYNTTFSAGAAVQHATININTCGSQFLMYSTAGGVAAFSGTWRSMCSAQQAYTPFLAVRIS